jgi:hypothetical protein
MESNDFTNLRQHRSDTDAWKPREWYRAIDERTALAAIAGLALVLHGINRHRSNSRMWSLISGAVVGCVAARIGNEHRRRNTRVGSESADIVTRESEDSFPASDAPSSNATTAAPQPLPRDR